MTGQEWMQLGALVALICVSTPVLGRYMAKVYAGGPAPGDRIAGPIERIIYRICRIDEQAEQRWSVYARAVLAFSAVSVIVAYGFQRLQGVLVLNPDGFGAVPPPLAFNTAVSFVTNTNWQNYRGESTMAHLTQMGALGVQNFASAAAGMAVAIALVRALARRQTATIGNFWVDLVRSCTRILLPVSILGAVAFIGMGAVQNFHPAREITTVEGARQTLPGGPIASQEAIKELGTNGGGPYNANSMHPWENPTPVSNLLQVWMLLMIPFALTWTFGLLVNDRRQGWAVFAAMFVLWSGSVLLATGLETGGNARLAALGADQTVSDTNPGGNMEGKEVRFGSAGCGMYSASTTATSTGAVDCAHDSMTPLGGAIPLINIKLGEVSPGGVGSGLYGMLVIALMSVFIAGLMVGRTPEYLGKKVQAAEMKLVVLYILIVPICILTFAAISVLWDTAVKSLANPGPHGLTEMVYAFTSAANNNGSAFGGLSGNTPWFNTTLGICMLMGRFLLIVPVLAIAGSLGRKQKVPESQGTFPTGTPLFAGLLVGVVLIIGGLTYFPVIALGPLVEHLSGKL
jgi:potassium-transporting ATPase potassium-binding subunit